jgi:ankyrin repeat protein
VNRAPTGSASRGLVAVAKRVLSALGLLVASVAISLVAAEAIVRALGHAPLIAAEQASLDQAVLMASLSARPEALKRHLRQGQIAATPLYIAARYGRERILAALWRLDADPNDGSDWGWSPMHAAALNGWGAGIRLLAENGAKLGLRDNAGYTPLHAAAQQGALAAMRELIRLGTDVDQRATNGDTALHLALSYQKSEAAALLVQNGAKLEVRNDEADLPLHEAVRSGNIEFVRLVASTAPHQVSSENNQGATALHAAVAAGNRDIVALLVKSGGHSKRDDAGLSARDWAKRLEREDLLALLAGFP